MKRTYLTRALLVAGVVAAAGAVQAQSLMDDSPLQASSQSSQTWFFPDGSSHTVMAQDTSSPDLNSLGAGSSSLMDDSSSDTTVTQTWFYPDGTSQTIAGSSVALSTNDIDTTRLGAGPSMLGTDSLHTGKNPGTISETFDSPLRAGEMSTMTNGVPNLLTDN